MKMKMKNGDQPITPLYGADKTLFQAEGIDSSYLKQANLLTGLTKREYFAGLAMASFFGKSVLPDDKTAKVCVEMADALLAELAKEQNT